MTTIEAKDVEGLGAVETPIDGRGREGWKFTDKFSGGSRGYTRLLLHEDVTPAQFETVRKALGAFNVPSSITKMINAREVFLVRLLFADSTGRIEAECSVLYDALRSRLYGTLYRAVFCNNIGQVGKQNVRTFGMGLLLNRVLEALDGAE